MKRPLPHLSPQIVDEIVLAAIEEDAAYNDVTTAALIPPAQWGRGVFVAKEDGVIAGLVVAAAAMTAIDDSISFDTLIEDGERVRADTELAEVEHDRCGQLVEDVVGHDPGRYRWGRTGLERTPEPDVSSGCRRGPGCSRRPRRGRCPWP